jgi:hypothetical protein
VIGRIAVPSQPERKRKERKKEKTRPYPKNN